MKDYARALLDGNLAEVAAYGPGARLVGSDDNGNKCAPSGPRLAECVGAGNPDAGLLRERGMCRTLAGRSVMYI